MRAAAAAVEAEAADQRNKGKRRGRVPETQMRVIMFRDTRPREQVKRRRKPSLADGMNRQGAVAARASALVAEKTLAINCERLHVYFSLPVPVWACVCMCVYLNKLFAE